MKVITGFHSIEERVNVFAKEKERTQKKAGEADNCKIFYNKIGPRVKKILETAQKAGVVSQKVEEAKLDELVQDLPQALQDHRGIVMTVTGEKQSAQNLVDFESWLKQSDEKQKQTVVILDKVTDPHNVGAILRSCDQFGADLVIIPEHNSASNIGENEVIGRTSAGASAWVPVSIVNNLTRAAEMLKQKGFWIYGADAGGETCSNIDFADKTVIIMGSEGNGISSLLEKQCDSIVSIPTCGKIDSLNVSVAAGVLLYELYRRKLQNQK